MGIDGRTPEDLVNEQVPQPGDQVLVHQNPFDRLRACPDRLSKHVLIDCRCVRAKSVGIWIELDRAQSPLVTNHDVDRAESEVDAIPRWIIPCRGIFEAVDRTSAVDQQPAGHSKAETHGHVVTRRPMSEHQEFAATMRPDQTATNELIELLDWCPARTYETWMTDLHRRHRRVDEWCERLPVQFDLDQFWHDVQIVRWSRVIGASARFDVNLREEVFDQGRKLVVLDEEAIVSEDRIDRVIRT